VYEHVNDLQTLEFANPCQSTNNKLPINIIVIDRMDKKKSVKRIYSEKKKAYKFTHKKKKHKKKKKHTWHPFAAEKKGNKEATG
jgi:hypothetical protein